MILPKASASASGRPSWPAVTPGLRRLGGESIRYAVVSAGALFCDVIVYTALVRIGLVASAAGALGYLAGLMLHFVVSASWVFPDPGGRRTVPTLAKFAASGVVGLVMTATIIGVLTTSGLAGPFVAKGIAIALTFAGVFLLRRSYVFAVGRG